MMKPNEQAHLLLRLALRGRLGSVLLPDTASMETESNQPIAHKIKECTECPCEEADSSYSAYKQHIREAVFDEPVVRNIERGVFHTTATYTDATIAGIKRYWREELGWSFPFGYHVMCRHDGSFKKMVSFNKVTNGVYGYNSTSVHFSAIFGVDKKTGEYVDNRSNKQKWYFKAIAELWPEYFPGKPLYGHHHLNPGKSCPIFEMDKYQKWAETA